MLTRQDGRRFQTLWSSVADVGKMLAADVEADLI